MTQDDAQHELRSRGDFVRFLRSLYRAWEQEGNEWCNTEIGEFLKGLRMYAEDLDRFAADFQFRGASPNVPSWDLFAELLYAARNYEPADRPGNCDSET